MRRRRRTIAGITAVVAVGAMLTSVPITASAAPAVGPIAINEVESSDGDPGDWVELMNTGDVAIDLGGYEVRDDKDRDAYVIPAGTVAEPGEFVVIDQVDGGVGGFDFGLGSADEVRLFDAGGAMVDAYAWDGHAAETYGRCPDGTGEFQPTESATKGAPNDCRVQVRINEVASSGGEPGDWVEFINVGDMTIDLGGFVFLDDRDDHRYALPAGSVIEPGGFFVLDEAEFGFGLGSADMARLHTPEGETVDEVTWNAHGNPTLGRCPDGEGTFGDTAAATKGAPNDCVLAPGATAVVVNEAESSGGIPGDWVELFNTGDSDVDLSGWVVRDDNDTRESVIPDGTVIEAGGYFIVEESALGFGLGANDMARLFTPDDTLVSELAWSGHAATSFGRCPNGTGEGVVQTSVTKGAENDCGAPVRINEVESSGGDPGDWVELANVGTDPVDVSGFVVRDDDDDHTYEIPGDTTIAPGGYLVIDDVDLGFGLGGNDQVRLWDAAGALLDEVSWSSHASTTLARCPDGTGPFAESLAPTKGGPNSCEGDLEIGPWPGPDTVEFGDAAGTFDGDLSGLDYDESRGILWAVVNGTGALWALEQDDTVWTPAAGWESGKQVRFADGAGVPDAEGVSVGPDGQLYIGVERDGDASGVSRNTVLQVDPDASGNELIATNEWNLNSVLPATGANSGVEAVEWVPADAAAGLVDESGAAYDAANSPGALPGVFFVGVEATGQVTALALSPDGTADVIATIDPGMGGVMALDYDSVLDVLWVVCDEACDGLAAQLALGMPDAAITYVARPGDMDNVANEGFATSPQSFCVDGLRPVWYADDNNTDGHSIRVGALACEASTPPVTTPPITTPPSTDPGDDAMGGVDAGAGADAAGDDGSGDDGSGDDGSGSEGSGDDGSGEAGRDGLAVTDGGLLPFGVVAALLLTGAAVLLARRRSV
ncbi:hypothetical protein GCM10011490_07730 [Pseudoclavibacter endophyticus]|uniref:LTD domain-containing protein n=1 Tax=Pseudoclavibacter endophyticus TaxID=1778590 RepID=A0A6H9WPS4_9MICO|nr:lamin tail domain-containing protein [Pseudoclavibacter endophyticus]KAB1649751.1 hypothetical protein F8O04_05815 [Pseudoclavibacter endophyticus]GGA60042.1 hypothetical protein GCM10011490_07730 [Pseudoclavibacter endophyticus]